MAGGKKTLLNEAEVAVEYLFQSIILAEYGIDIAEHLQGAGWENYFNMKEMTLIAFAYAQL